MKYILAAAIVALTLQTAQQEPPRHDKYKDDPDAFCWNPARSGTLGKTRERDPHAHKCECHLMCMIGPDNEVSNDQESPNCELYCTRSHCTCHVEEPCEMPKHDASASNRSTYFLRQADTLRQLRASNKH